jgi:acyl dehydratase
VTSAIGKPPAPYRVQAHNTSTASENRIHSDDEAAKYGFRGGLVPGVAVYAYMTRPAVDLFGQQWVETGTMSARFVQPFYEGDDVVVTPAIDGGNALQLEATRGDGGDVCATGRAGVREPAAPPEGSSYPDVPTPAADQRPPATTEVLRSLPGLALPPVRFHADKAAEYLDGIADDHPLFRDEGVAHPGWLIRFANAVLSANVRLGPWIHTGSEVTHFRAVVDGDQVSTRARVADLFERKGHRFVTLDVVLLVGDSDPVLRATHTAIYEIAPRT